MHYNHLRFGVYNMEKARLSKKATLHKTATYEAPITLYGTAVVKIGLLYSDKFYNVKKCYF